MDKRGWNQVDLTYVLGCTPKAVNLIINGKQGISPAMSKALGEAFELPPGLFADLQLSFEIAEAEEPNPNVGLRAQMMRNFPVREMIRRGWLPQNPKDLSEEIASFFEVSETENIPYMPHAAKKTNYLSAEVPPPQLAWLFRVRHIAKSISVPKYSVAKLRAALQQMQQLIAEPEEARHVPRILAECGVRFVIVESLPKSAIDGVCFWLSNDEPVIGMSMRRDQNDNFWFVLRHEIEHVLRGDGRDIDLGMVDLEIKQLADDGGELPEAEQIANAAAADFCVLQTKFQSFLKRKKPFYYEKDVIAFAKVNNTHPGLVAGQLQYATGRYDYLTNLQCKIRNHVLPNAIVDGFKQTVPLN